MPVLIVAVVEDNERAIAESLLPLNTNVAMKDINAVELRTYPLESILELSVRPAATAVLTVWREKNRRT